MCEKRVELEINDLFNELKEENNRLLSELSITKKFIKLSENYRNFIKSLVKCECNRSKFIENKLNLLENEFKLLKYEIISKGFEEKVLQKSNQKTLKRKTDSNSEICQNKRSINGKDSQTFEAKADSKTDNPQNESSFDSNKSELKTSSCLREHNNNEMINENQKFKCNNHLCYFTTYDSDIFERHQRRHLGLNPYKCNNDLCDESFNSKDKLEKHVSGVHLKDKPFKCSECSTAFTVKAYLNAHKTLKHSRVYRHTCDKCHYKTNRLSDIKKHSSVHSIDKQFECDFEGCDKKYARIDALKRHQLSHCEERPLGCDWPGCEARFCTNHDLKVHMRYHSGDKPFKCEECDNSYVSKSLLWAHIQSHKEYSFVCDVCDYKTYRNSKLRKHMKIHTEEKPFKCLVIGCEKSFREKAHLNAHKMLVHDNISLYSCYWPNCAKSVKSKNQLSVHYRTHTGEKPFVCEWPGCDSKFTSSKNLKTHRFKHIKEKPFKCESIDCNKKFIAYYEMRKHFNLKHSDKQLVNQKLIQ